MTSELRVDKIHNEGGDNDSGIDLSTNDQIVLKTANTTRLTMNATGQTTIVGEGGSTTTNLQQGLTKVWARVDQVGTQGIDDSFNLTSITDAGTALTTFTFANDMSNVNYAVTSCAEYNSLQSITAQATGSAGVAIMNASSAYEDRDMTSIKVSGDLA